jgi:hypothetical protein
MKKTIIPVSARFYRVVLTSVQQQVRTLLLSHPFATHYHTFIFLIILSSTLTSFFIFDFHFGGQQIIKVRS